MRLILFTMLYYGFTDHVLKVSMTQILNWSVPSISYKITTLSNPNFGYYIWCNHIWNLCWEMILRFQAPYQKKLIDTKLLVPEEIEWLNKYHSRCSEILAPYLNSTEMEWLKSATQPIAAWLYFSYIYRSSYKNCFLFQQALRIV